MDISRNSQIVEAFKAGNVAGLIGSSPPEKYLKTWMSHVFIFEEAVYKVLQSDNIEFNRGWRDIGNPEVRRWFYGEDFFWNRYFNLEVYEELLGVKVEDGLVRIVGKDDNPDDFVIKMKRINADHNLTWQLHSELLTPDNARTVGYEMTRLIAEFPKKPESNLNWHDYMHSRLVDLVDFCHLAEQYISREESGRVMQCLFDYLEVRKERFSAISQAGMVIGIDNHSDNVFCSDGHASFIDIYQIKDNWLLVEPELNIYRLNADVLVLGGEEASRTLLDGFFTYYPDRKRDEGLGRFYTVYGAIIKGAYLQILDKPGEAAPYWKYVYGQLEGIRS